MEMTNKINEAYFDLNKFLTSICYVFFQNVRIHTTDIEVLLKNRQRYTHTIT